jgi:uncharacterized damage-inducible protein DinB
MSHKIPRQPITGHRTRTATHGTANRRSCRHTATQIDDVKQLPPLGETVAAWAAASYALRDRLETLTAAELDGPTAAPFFAPEQTMLGALTFLVQHDSYHLGQLAFLRKLAGLPAMRYT